MRLMSFCHTKPQVKSKTKTVTRRIGWENLKPGTFLQACGKVMGRKRVEPLDRIAVIRVINVRREMLGDITQHDVIREGFPNMSPDEFIDMFRKIAKKLTRDSIVTRIEFEYSGEQTEMFEYIKETK